MGTGENQGWWVPLAQEGLHVCCTSPGPVMLCVFLAVAVVGFSLAQE